MTVRPILRWPQPVLRRAADPVAEIDDEVRQIWDDMVETMYAMPGVGLAAPQIGIGRQIAVVDASDTHDVALRLANPEVIEASEDVSVFPEASPCLPGVNAEITRPERVTVGFLNAEGVRVTQTFTGLWATSVQHQIDHLNGRMYFDNLSRVKREMLLKRAKKVAS
ncbi:MAG: peptide deformylase [Pseudomonadota bacterium]